MRIFYPHPHTHPVDKTPGYMNKSVCIIFVCAYSGGVNSSVVSSHIYKRSMEWCQFYGVASE